jgi:hypothetical protein
VTAGGGSRADAAPRRILFLMANPDETTRLNLEKEFGEVRRALEQGTHRETLDLQAAPGIRVEELQHRLDVVRAQVVHFSGHGSEARKEIILYNARDESSPVPREALAILLANVECVVLNACSSADQAKEIATRGPLAIGMAGPISTDDATCFSRGFYGKLADGASFRDAFKGGRLQLALESRSGKELPRIFPPEGQVAPGIVAAPTPHAVAVEDVAPQKAMDLAFAQAGTAVRVALCLVSDESAELARAVAGWRDRLRRDPLLPAPAKERARKGDLKELFADPSLQGHLFNWLSTTTFSAYAHYGDVAALTALGADESARRLRVDLLVDRLRKKSERIATIRSSVQDLDHVVASAVERVTSERRETPVPLSPPNVVPSTRRGADTFVTLAEVVAEVVAKHLADLKDEAASVHFASVATRLRFAKDVVSGETHTRAKNPLA